LNVVLLQIVRWVFSWVNVDIHGMFATCSFCVCYIFTEQKYGFCRVKVWFLACKKWVFALQKYGFCFLRECFLFCNTSYHAHEHPQNGVALVLFGNIIFTYFWVLPTFLYLTNFAFAKQKYYKTNSK